MQYKFTLLKFPILTLSWQRSVWGGPYPYRYIGICPANQWTDVYMIGTSIIIELRQYQISNVDKSSPVYYFQKCFQGWWHTCDDTTCCISCLRKTARTNTVDSSKLLFERRPYFFLYLLEMVWKHHSISTLKNETSFPLHCSFGQYHYYHHVHRQGMQRKTPQSKEFSCCCTERTLISSVDSVQLAKSQICFSATTCIFLLYNKSQ